jgi:glycogen synthase
LKLLLFTRFYPNVGGIETGSEVLAREWVKMGHDVTVATDVALNDAPIPEFPFRVIHQPSSRVLLREVSDCDLFILFNIRLKTIWAAMLWPSKLIATHHGFYWIDRNGNRDWRERLKLRITRGLPNITVSRAVAKEVGAPCHVIPAPYDRQKFKRTNPGPRNRELVFVGRLVSDKGVDVALRALAKLRAEGMKPRFTIVGEGDEKKALCALAAQLGVSDQVCFTGGIPTAELVATLNNHEIMLVPSLWKEPFGLVAVEGIACGCAVIGSSGGGLPEAIGKCGVTFQNGDVNALANAIRDLLNDREKLNELRSHADAHVAQHEPTNVAAEYIRYFERVLGGDRTSREQPSESFNEHRASN